MYAVVSRTIDIMDTGSAIKTKMRSSINEPEMTLVNPNDPEILATVVPFGAV